MAFDLLALLDGGATSTTGGTAITFTPGSTEIKNGVEVVDAASTDFLMRKRVQAVVIPPTVRADGTKSKAKWSNKLVIPALDSLGNVVYNLVSTRIELHPDSQAADATLLGDLRVHGAQLLTVAAMDYFYLYGDKS